MTVFKKIKKIEVWDCGYGHNHTTKEIAERCAAKTSKPKREIKWTFEILMKLKAMREGGALFKECGEAFGVGMSQASYQYYRACRVYNERLKRGLL